MSTIIQIKRNSGTTAPTTSDLIIGELAYAYDASNNGASGKLYIEATNSSSAADIHIIGGKYYTDLLDHTLGTTTASSALLVDSNSKLDVINIDNVTINGNDISSTNSNGNLTLTPNGTGYVDINKNDGFKLPAGTTAQRLASPTAGLIRYNSSLASFEGYGTAWGSLGGLIDVDSDTKITAESAAGQDEDVLTFYVGVSNTATSQLILADGVLKPTTDNDIDLGTASLEFKDAFFDGTVTTDGLTVSSTTNLDGAIQVDNTLTVGVDDAGYDVKLFGDAASAYMLWDTSADDLILAGVAGLTVAGTSGLAVTTATSLTVDDVAIDGKVITMTGSGGDTAVLTAGTNGTLSIVTADAAAAAANIQITADGTVDIDSAGVLTLDSGAAINLEPASGSAILLDGTISVDAGVVTGATSITSTAFVGTLSTAAQANVTSLGTLTVLNADNLRLDGNTFSSTDSNGNITIAPNGTGNVIASTDILQVQAASDEGATVHILAGEAENAKIILSTDESDDAGDDWTISAAAADNTLKIGNDIASAGTSVAHVTITPHATVASSTFALGGGLTVAGVTTFSGAVNMNSQATTNVNVDSGVIDGVTLGQNSVVTIATIDDLTLDGQTISTTASNKNIILTPHGTGNVAVNSDTLSVTGTEGETASLFLIADESDDASDDWSITANTGGTLTFGNDIASAGTQVAHLTITPHATIASSTIAAAGHLTVAGNLTVSGTTTTVSSTVTTIADPLIELATGTSGTPSNDAGHVIERGDSDNIFIGWDESADVFTAATGSFTGASTGNLSITPAAAKFGSLTLTTDLAVAEGGTGVSSFTDKGIVYGDGSSALDVTAAPGGADVTTSFQILTCATSNGNPVWTTTIDGGTY